MNTETPDRELERAIQRLANVSVTGFDAAGTARAATAPQSFGWRIAASVALAAAALMAVVIVIANDPPAQRGQTTATVVPNPSALEATPAPATPGAGLLSRVQAIAVSREAVPGAADWEVAVATFGPAQDVLYGEYGYHLAEGLASDRQVWAIVLKTGPQGATSGAIVIVDARDGTVLDTMRWIE